MYILITLITSLTASIFFSECWLRGKHPRIIRLCISCISGTAAYFILLSFFSRGAFLGALLIGQAACLIYDFICKERQLLLPEMCLYLGGNAVWIPLCLCNKDVWHYAVYIAAFFLCVSLVLINTETEKKTTIKTAEFFTDTRMYYWLISCLPCFTLVFSCLILAVAETSSVLSALLLCLSLTILHALILWLQMEVSRRLNAEYMNDSMNKWQQESRDYMNTIRSQRHDFNLHLHAVSGLINSGEYKQCQQYVQELVSQAADVNDIMPVCDAVVGSMLYNMREEARSRGSDILYHITYDMEEVLCNGFECNKIIGNLLQNAIDALQTPEDKAYGIRLSIFKRTGNTVIISENRFNSDPDRIARVFEPGYSTKKGHEGIGLSMVLRTVERYGGRVYPEFEEDKIRFIVNIPNKVNLQKGDKIL